MSNNKRTNRKDEILQFLRNEKIKYDSVEFTKLAGKFIKIRRKELKISPLDVAKSLNISYRTYNKYENGQINIPFNTLILITKNLNISMDSLINSFYKEIYGPDYMEILGIQNEINEELSKYNSTDLDKSINIVKKIYKSGNKILILALKGTLDIYQSLIYKKP